MRKCLGAVNTGLQVAFWRDYEPLPPFAREFFQWGSFIAEICCARWGSADWQ